MERDQEIEEEWREGIQGDSDLRGNHGECQEGRVYKSCRSSIGRKCCPL